MDDMAEEFGEMLRVWFIVCCLMKLLVTCCVQETLEKMRDRIEISSNNYEGPDLVIQQRMEELKMSE